MTRVYDQQIGCPVAATLDVIGERWTILILRDLVLGRSGRFTDLMESLQGISTNLLAERLKALEAEGITERSYYNDHPPRAEYRLTSKGAELGPIIKLIAEWGYKHQLSRSARARWKPPW